MFKKVLAIAGVVIAMAVGVGMAKDYNAEFVRGGYGYTAGDVIVMKSQEDLTQFKNRIIDSWNKLDGYSEEFVAPWIEQLNLQLSKYDSDFFSQNDLFYAFLSGDSGSVRYSVSNITYSDTTVTVTVCKHVPFICTMDFVEQSLFVPVEKTSATTGVLDLKVVRQERTNNK